MARTADILVIGGGIAGLSAAASLAPHARVIVLEGEAQIGTHATGRSATMFHYALGDALIRELTLASRWLFESAPAHFSDAPPTHPLPILLHARADEVPLLDDQAAALAPFAMLEEVDEAELKTICPVLRVGEGGAVRGLLDRATLRIDQHALMEGFARQLRSAGGTIVTGAQVTKIERAGGHWSSTTQSGDRFGAPILVNAAGAWADQVAVLAGARPIGLAPKRRTIITFDAPGGIDPSRLPFAKTVVDDLYFGPESGRIFASPMDEAASEPTDAQAGEYEVALAAQRVEERTEVVVERIRSKWAGLRSFAPDRHPAVGFASDCEGFFWLAGQGGAGLQTSPAIAAIVVALLTDGVWPVRAVAQSALDPNRFLRKPA